MQLKIVTAVGAMATTQKQAIGNGICLPDVLGQLVASFASFISPVGLGSWSLGALIGGIASYFIVRQHVFTLGAFSAVIGVVGGAGVLQLLSGLNSIQDRGVWWYPCGLLFGAVIVAIWWDPGLNSAQKKSGKEEDQAGDGVVKAEH
ncbi:hypothetical protein [Caulobacter flavus]|nr:hypothetical protein [Caulobacter flavus]